MGNSTSNPAYSGFPSTSTASFWSRRGPPTFPGFPDAPSAEFSSTNAGDVGEMLSWVDAIPLACPFPHLLNSVRHHPQPFIDFMNLSLDRSSFFINPNAAILSILKGQACIGRDITALYSDDPSALSIPPDSIPLDSPIRCCFSAKELRDTLCRVDPEKTLPETPPHFICPSPSKEWGRYDPDDPDRRENWMADAQSLASFILHPPARFIIFPVTLQSADEELHSNSIVYDSLTTSITYIEPLPNPHDFSVQNAVLTFFSSAVQHYIHTQPILRASYTYKHLCQSLDPEEFGRCQSWMSLISMYVIFNPDVHIRNIMSSLSVPNPSPPMLFPSLVTFFLASHGALGSPLDELVRRARVVERSMEKLAGRVRVLERISGRPVYSEILSGLSSTALLRGSITDWIILSITNPSTEFPSYSRLTKSFYDTVRCYAKNSGPGWMNSADDILQRVGLTLSDLYDA